MVCCCLENICSFIFWENHSKFFWNIIDIAQQQASKTALHTHESNGPWDKMSTGLLKVDKIKQLGQNIIFHSFKYSISYTIWCYLSTLQDLYNEPFLHKFFFTCCNNRAFLSSAIRLMLSNAIFLRRHFWLRLFLTGPRPSGQWAANLNICSTYRSQPHAVNTRRWHDAE